MMVDSPRLIQRLGGQVCLALKVSSHYGVTTPIDARWRQCGAAVSQVDMLLLLSPDAAALLAMSAASRVVVVSTAAVSDSSLGHELLGHLQPSGRNKNRNQSINLLEVKMSIGNCPTGKCY